MLIVELEHCEEGFLRHLHVADLLHALLASLLFFKELALTAYVTSVALRCNVLAHLLYGFSCYDFASDGSLDGYVELLAWKEFLEAFAHAASQYHGIVYVDECGECVDALAVEKDIELHKL